MSKIEWTERTWNPVVGCSKVSPGCTHCYAETMARRLKAMGTPSYENGFAPSIRPERLGEPGRRRKPTFYFVNSMSDLFHEDVPFDFIDEVCNAMRGSPQHTFQVLTKRSWRMAEYFTTRHVPDNMWLGVSVEDTRHGLPRLEALRTLAAPVRFLSIEPLLEDLGPMDLRGIHWVIVGGESGPKARPMAPAWVEDIRSQCERESVPFFFKQWGGWGADGKRRAKKRNGRMLGGRTWDQMPVPGIQAQVCS